MSATAVMGTNPPEGRPFWTLRCIASILALNLASVESQPSLSSFVSASLADTTGLYLRAFLARRLVRSGPDEDATGGGSGDKGGTVPCETG